MKLSLLLLGLCLFLGACDEDQKGVLHKACHQPVTSLTIKTRDGDKKFTVERACQMSTQIQGLMFRRSMPEMHGMLFVYDVEKLHSFWMKNTYLPLDLLFLDKNGVIVDIIENAIPMDETSLPSRKPAMYVLEVNGGTARKFGIRLQDKASLKQ